MRNQAQNLKQQISFFKLPESQGFNIALNKASAPITIHHTTHIPSVTETHPSLRKAVETPLQHLHATRKLSTSMATHDDEWKDF
jgi:hypothetical protein